MIIQYALYALLVKEGEYMEVSLYVFVLGPQKELSELQRIESVSL
jgi:hypothetical protein